ncbi:hypothetical protein QJR52_06520 [Clostridium baratii]|uniref:type II restriction enzyme n=1 Tax=Clostridium baratii TaxID=1561 RepID=UPI0030D39422
MSKSKLEKEWEKILKDFDILNKVNRDGEYTLSSKDINKYREARLMTKFDYEEALPECFRKNNLTILPISRGKYKIGRFNIFTKIKYDNINKRIPFELPPYIESININNLYSESASIYYAFLTRMLEDVIGEYCDLTISGRMGTGKFDFVIGDKLISDKTYKLQIENSQCEIDAGYEGEEVLALIEAKNYKVTNFVTRQLYYPYRLWKDKLGNKKQVLPIFFTYDKVFGRFSFFVFKFKDINRYDSIELVSQVNYLVQQESISDEEIMDLIENTPTVKETMTLPQADDFSKVIDLLSILTEVTKLTNIDILNNYNFTERQVNYYVSAAIYLGLVERIAINVKIEEEDAEGVPKEKVKKERFVVLSEEGKQVMFSWDKDRKLKIARSILKHKIFKETVKFSLENFRPITSKECEKIMKKVGVYRISGSTIPRRSSTVRGWSNWILSLIQPEE